MKERKSEFWDLWYYWPQYCLFFYNDEKHPRLVELQHTTCLEF